METVKFCTSLYRRGLSQPSWSLVSEPRVTPHKGQPSETLSGCLLFSVSGKCLLVRSGLTHFMPTACPIGDRSRKVCLPGSSA